MSEAKANRRSLRLSDLNAGMPTLTAAVGRSLAEAAAVCLDHHGHPECPDLPVINVSGESVETFELRRPRVTQKMRQTHADLQDATESGACAVALLLMHELTGWTIVRAAKGTGIDYWIGAVDETDIFPFQAAARLEVSGILAGTEAQCRSRLEQKSDQSRQSDESGLAAYSIVVEFRAPRVVYEQRNLS